MADYEPAIKKISLSLTGRYASSWGTWEGVREIIQNWHDGLYETKRKTDAVAEHRQWSLHYEKQDETQTGDQFDIYEAFLRYYNHREDATEKKVEHSKCVLGYLIYEKKEYGRLCVINKDISLQKKILLLGYSEKPDICEVIGQFGEGLKVGALALVRDGRIVTMETGKDLWRFELNMDAVFGEKLLTVHVTPRAGERDGTPSCAVCNLPTHIELLETDTLTTVSLESDLWRNNFERRFLFLLPAKNIVRTELGELMLDRDLAGQLYVKNVWVADMREEDLATGVNFVNLRIDRDRNAVPKPSEIDHLIGSMWIKALEFKPQLSNTYYKLLKNDKYRDVRQAMVYADQMVANLVADQFEEEHGDKALPVSNSLASSELERIRSMLDVELILVNDTLLKLLHMSGRHKPVEEELKAMEKPEFSLFKIQEITDEERVALEHSMELVRLAHPDASIGNCDIIEYTSPTQQGCTRKEQRTLVPRWMLLPDHAHITRNVCPTQQMNKCKCMEVRLMCSLCNLYSGAQMGGSAQYEHHLLSVVRPLVAQACDRAQAYCMKLHIPDSASDSTGASHYTCQETEKTLRKEYELLKDRTEAKAADFRRQIDSIGAALRDAEKALVEKEMETFGDGLKLRDEFDYKFKQSQESWKEKVESYKRKADEMEQRRLEAEQHKHHWKTKYDMLKEESERMEEAIERKQTFMLEELLHYVHQCRTRTMSFEKWCQEALQCENLDDQTKDKLSFLQEVATILSEELQKDKFMCCVCKQRRKDMLFIPCGHYAACERCVTQLKERVPLKCPTCKTEVDKTQKVYG